MFVSDFGAVTHAPHYMMAGLGVVCSLDMEQIKITYLRPFQSTPMGKTGDSSREQILVDATLKVENEKGLLQDRRPVPAPDQRQQLSPP